MKFEILKKIINVLCISRQKCNTWLKLNTFWLFQTLQTTNFGFRKLNL